MLIFGKKSGEIFTKIIEDKKSKLLATLDIEAHKDQVNDMISIKGSNLVVSASRDKNIGVFLVEEKNTLKKLQILEGHDDEVLSLTYS